MSEEALGIDAPRDRVTPPDRVDSALAALDRMDLEAFVSACRSLAPADDEPTAHGPTAVRLYEVLRSAAETLDGAAIDLRRAERRRWAALLEGTEDPLERQSRFLIELERLVDPYRRKQAPINPTVLRALRFIETHAAERISLSRVAKEVGLARNYMSSLFHRETGVTMTEYIHRVRIRRAVSLLQGGNIPMTEVAKRVGYGSYRHFHRRFSRLLAVSPTHFQRHPSAAHSADLLVPRPRE